MSGDSQDLSLGEAVSRFLADLSPEEKGSNQQGIYRFVRWFGGERPLAGLTAAEVANYAERLSFSDTDYLRKLESVRAFLAQAKKEGWSKTNLAVHLKARKVKTGLRPSPRRGVSETIILTRPGHAELAAELATLQSKRYEVIDEMRRAAADKDFRENVPLAAAREQRGQIEGRIMELEETLKSAVVIDEQQVEVALRVGIGDSVTLCDIETGEELRYMLVSPREVDPTRGKISNASPIGKAIVGKEQGEVVEIIIPAGKLRYQIRQIARDS